MPMQPWHPGSCTRAPEVRNGRSPPAWNTFSSTWRLPGLIVRWSVSAIVFPRSTAAATTPLLAPSGLAATPVSPTRVDLAWSPLSNGVTANIPLVPNFNGTSCATTWCHSLGGSYGGFMALAQATMHPELWAATVDIVGIANWATFFQHTGEWRRAFRAAEYGGRHRRQGAVQALLRGQVLAGARQRPPEGMVQPVGPERSFEVLNFLGALADDH